MLKIRDDIDLKELEKFGFEYMIYINQKVYKKIVGMETSNFIIGEDRIIHYNQCSIYYNTLDNTLYDLIQAGLVEKVGEVIKCIYNN